jgi:HD-like signal output (HDOD) protein
MARPSIQEIARERVLIDLEAALMANPPGIVPITLVAVSRRTGVSRMTLRKYGLDAHVREAAERSQAVTRTRIHQVRHEAEDRLRERDALIAQLRQANEALLAHVALAESNAHRLGIDPDELWQPIPTPPRLVPYTPHRPGRRG